MGETTEREGARRRRKNRVTSVARLFCRILCAHSVKRRNGERRNPYRVKASVCTFCFLRSRAINELTRKPAHVFRDHNSALSNPSHPAFPPILPVFPRPRAKNSERDTLELKDYLWTTESREGKLERERERVSRHLRKNTVPFWREGELNAVHIPRGISVKNYDKTIYALVAFNRASMK